MKIHRSLRLALAGLATALAGCAQKQVMAPPPPAPAVAQAPVVQSAPPPPPSTAAAATASAKDQIQALLSEALNPIYFDYNMSQVKPEGKAILAKIGQILKAHPEIELNVAGNTDERGSTEYNQALGEKRAQAASQWLVSYGVKKSQLKTISYGKEQPAAVGHDEAAWSKNRRDEFKAL